MATLKSFPTSSAAIRPQAQPRVARAAGPAVLALLLALTSCKKPEVPLPAVTEDGTPVVAMVGTEPVTMASLQIIAAQNGYNLQKADDRELALRDAVNNELLAAEAKKLGYENDPDIRRYVKSQTVQKLLLATVDKEPQGTAPTEAELKAYYDAHLKDYTPPTLVKAQILGLLKRKGQEAQFAEKMAALKAAIAAKQVPFSELVKQFSDDPAAQAHAGLTNWIVQGDANKQYPDAVSQAVFGAKDAAAIIGPIEHHEWTYFVKLAERREGTTAGFAEAKGQIAQQLMRKKRVESYDRFVQRLKAGLQVQTYPEKIDAEIQAATKQGGPPKGPVRMK